MAINIKTPGLHHVTLRSRDLGPVKAFLFRELGFPIIMELPTLVVFRAGATALVVRGPEAGHLRAISSTH